MSQTHFTTMRGSEVPCHRLLTWNCCFRICIPLTSYSWPVLKLSKGHAAKRWYFSFWCLLSVNKYVVVLEICGENSKNFGRKTNRKQFHRMLQAQVSKNFLSDDVVRGVYTVEQECWRYSVGLLEKEKREGGGTAHHDWRLGFSFQAYGLSWY